MITDTQALSQFVRELGANARALLGDAELLLENERWPRALALATLAKEEGAKVLMVLLSHMEPSAARAMRQNNHEDKLQAAAATELAFLRDLDDFHQLVEQVDGATAHRQKMAAIYVDCRDGTLTTPASVTSEGARRAYEDASTFIQWVGKLVDTAAPEVLASAFNIRDRLFPALEAFFEEHGEKMGFELLRQMNENALAADAELGGGVAPDAGAP